MADNTQEAPDPQRLKNIPTAALVLGAAGALPFIAAAAGALILDAGRGPALLALLTYGAVILSFLGGIRWGMAIARAGSDTALNLSISIVPAVVAWGALLLPPQAGMLTLAAAFVVMLILDILAARLGQAPSWYPRLRIPLTVVVVAALAVGAMT